MKFTKFLALTLCLIMVLGMLPITAGAAEIVDSGYCGGEGDGTNLAWTLTADGTLTISGTGRMAEYRTNKTSSPWIEYTSCIKNLNICSGVVSIGSRSFYGCNNLYSVNIPNSVTTIGHSAFYNCTYLADVTIPNSITSIEHSAFQGCDSLSAVYITDIGAWCKINFYSDYSNPLVYAKKLYLNNSLVTALNIPEGITSIGACAFINCNSLVSVSIPSSVTTIESSAFYNCDNLLSVSFSKNIAFIGGRAFVSCDTLSNAYFAGNAPSVYDSSYSLASTPPSFDSNTITLYYIPGTAGWTDSDAYDAEAGTWNGYKLAIWYEEIADDDSALKIVEQSPNNKGTLTPTANKTVISMTFSHEIESVQTGISFDEDNNIIVHGNFSIVRQIEESEDWEFETVYSLSENNNEETDVTVDGKSVCFDISDAELILGETYYVLMDNGVISFKDTDEKIGFGGTQWTFTVSGNKTGTFRYKAQYGITEYPYSYDDNWFSGETTAYNHDLAKLSLRAAIAAYGTGSNSDGSEYIQEFMTNELGFHNLDVYYPTPQRNSIGYAIGSKAIPSEDSEDGKKSLILVAIRGGGYGAEWGGNFMIGTGNFKDGIAGDMHEGFSRAADQVAYGLESYIRWQKSEGHLSDDCVVWIVGYSRAAATANLLAKYLDDGNVEDISKENVFAYCFECPQNSRATDLNNIKYDNIMNIVNPIDFVTMVAMDEWNYGRYGQTFYLPYVEGAENYDDLSDKMAKCYTEIIESGTGVNDVWLATRQLKGQLDMTNGLMNWLADTFYSPEIYTALYQEALIECVEAGVRGELLLKDCPALAIMLIKLGLIAKDTFSIPNPMEEPLDFIDAVSSSIDNIYAAWAIESLVLEFSSSKDFSKTYLTYAHYPELCLAWMDSLSGSNSFVSNKYRKVFINCPVDVFVYDSSNTLVGSVVDRAVQEINNGISIYIDGNEQIVISLPVTEEYIIEIKATDTGTVTYTVTEHNVETNASERVVSYQELIIDKDDLLIGTIENLAKTDSAKYPFTHNGDEQNPTVDQKGNQVVYHSVICTIEGNGVVKGGGGALHGEYRKLIATPDENESFIGWYVDDKLVSSESEYRFLVAADTVLTAKFTGTKKAPESFLVTGAAYDVKSIDEVDSILYGAFESAEVTDGVDSYVVQKTDGSIPVIAEIMFGVDSNTAATEFENGTYINYQNVFDVDNAMYNPSGNMGLYTNLIYADKDAETDELTAFSPANTVNWKLAEGEIEAKSEEITLESGKLTLDDSTEVYLYIYYPNEDMYNVTTFTGHERLPSLTVDYDGYGVVNCYGVPNESDSGVAGIVVFEIKISSDSEGEPVYPEEDDSCFGDIIDFMPGVIALIAASEDEENKTVKEESSSIQMYVDTFPFADVSSADWYYDNVRYAYYNHIMSGVTDTLFAPDSTLTRGMVAQILYNMEGQPNMVVDNPFTDVADSAWYKTAVTWAASNSIVNGYGDGRFGPEDKVTREQLAAILYRYAQYKGMAAVTMEENLLAFADQAEISEYAVSAMNWAVGKGLISGLPNSILDPKGNATRAQAAAIIHRLCLSGCW